MKNSNYIIVDGHNYLYRAYYGIPHSAVLPNGLKVNAYYGFMAFLRKVIQEYSPNRLLVVFDSEEGTNARKLKNSEYKSNRNYEDKQIFEQLKIIKMALDYCNVQYLEDKRYEADDIIGSLSKAYASNSDKLYISSNDNDYIQCLDINTILIKSIKGKFVEYTKDFVIENYGFEPKLYLDYISLKGDSSDNITGVPGVGEKTATKLIQEYGGVENILDSNTKSSNLLNKVKKSRDTVLLNKEVLRISKNLSIKVKDQIFETALLLDNSSNEILRKIGIMNENY